jgi:hypothetical protein
LTNSIQHYSIKPTYKINRESKFKAKPSSPLKNKNMRIKTPSKIFSMKADDTEHPLMEKKTPKINGILEDKAKP